MTATRERFLGRYEFPLDAFQLRALDALDAGQSVLVAAPTGSGKTIVAEYAVELALDGGSKIFYTAPIKALSNQKYGDLVARYGAAQVGLLTGDNSINGDAPVVVMTTEVLRNMIYSRSPALERLRFVVLDEVHYLQDLYRGPVWEEVIIHLPPAVRLVCLSATVSNAEELAEWITTVRGATAAIIEERRPVELVNLYLVGDRSSPELHLLPTLVDGRPNPEADRLDAESLRGRVMRGRPRRRYFTPYRVEVIERLREEDMLPAIYFIFSRAACNDAAAACIDAGLRLTSADERVRIRAIAEERVAALSDADLDVLGYDRWLEGLELGVAAHHAGMVPPFKEAVEACFAAGLVKVVFATETLALGINMPARTVVIEKLSKFTGERHEFLTPGEYTQLTGRAGRRGIDSVGHAVVLWSPFVPFDQVAGLASSRSFRLTSAFRPTYNMAVNLVRSYPPDEAHHLLNLSFAQYQADQAVVRLEARLEKRREVLGRLRAEAACELGDVDEYLTLATVADEARRHSATRSEVEGALSALRPGDVIDLDSTRAAVLTYANRRADARVRLVTALGKVLTLGTADFQSPPPVLGHIDLPTPFMPNNHGYQHQVAKELRRARLGGGTRRAQRDMEAAEAADAARELVEAHPVHDCPDRDRHLRSRTHAERVAREVEELERSVRGRTESLARRFDRVLRILDAWGYLEGWQLSDRGEVLARVYHECDLLIAEALCGGLLDGLDAPSLTAVASTFTYEHRSSTPPPAPWFPSVQVRDRFATIEALADELRSAEQAAALPFTRRPDAGFVALAYAWASGEALDEVLADEDVSGGDFVRNIKQLLDLLRQIQLVAPNDSTRAAAGAAAESLFRGIVAASSAVGSAEEDDLAEDDLAESTP